MYKGIMIFLECKCRVKKPTLLLDIGDKISAIYCRQGAPDSPISPATNTRYVSEACQLLSIAEWVFHPPPY